MKTKSQFVPSIIFPKSSREIRVKDQIGAGSYATVYSTFNQEYVIKVINLSDPKSQLSAENERRAYTIFCKKTDHLVHCEDFRELNVSGSNHAVFLLENCSKGSLVDFLSATVTESSLPENIVLEIMYAIAQGVREVHSKGVIHRDLKLENVLIGMDGKLKLCDFGSISNQIIERVPREKLEEIKEDIEKNTTPFYRSPEQCDLYSGYPITEKSDIWALGVIMFMICFQKPPFESPLATINCQYFLPSQNNYSEKVMGLLKLAFKTNPAERIDIKQFIEYIANRFENIYSANPATDKEHKLGSMNFLDGTGADIFESSIQGKKITPKIMDKFNKYFKRLTKKTEGKKFF
jgi:serine/threonine protein kinase